MKTKTQKPVSSVIYNGPSLLDGQSIVVIAIISSNNSKTGNMIQTHILRADVNPLEASKTGADASICGDCIHRGQPTDNPIKKTAVDRSCYVNLGQGPTVVYKGYKRGLYPTVTNPEEISAIGHNRAVRLGTYGDPAAVPAYVWDALLKKARTHTSYTHQHKANNPTAYNRMMYSADSVEDAKKAQSKGYRTFRVIPVKQWQDNGIKSLLANEIICPASKENDKGLSCIECKLCTGSQSKAKSIAIVSHGIGANKFKG
jgi:hypothetical protein